MYIVVPLFRETIQIDRQLVAFCRKLNGGKKVMTVKVYIQAVKVQCRYQVWEHISIDMHTVKVRGAKRKSSVMKQR